MKRAQLLAVVITILSASHLFASDWPRFRGPNGSGISTESNVPTEWSSTNNLRWRSELPGPGTSSPIVVDDRIS